MRPPHAGHQSRCWATERTQSGDLWLQRWWGLTQAMKHKQMESSGNREVRVSRGIEWCDGEGPGKADMLLSEEVPPATTALAEPTIVTFKSWGPMDTFQFSSYLVSGSSQMSWPLCPSWNFPLSPWLQGHHTSGLPPITVDVHSAFLLHSYGMYSLLYTFEPLIYAHSRILFWDLEPSMQWPMWLL